MEDPGESPTAAAKAAEPARLKNVFFSGDREGPHRQ